MLSVVSTQLRSILTAVQLKKKTFEFMGQEILVNSKVGFFVTMNPGYAGRAELPDSLKVTRQFFIQIPNIQFSLTHLSFEIKPKSSIHNPKGPSSFNTFYLDCNTES